MSTSTVLVNHLKLALCMLDASVPRRQVGGSMASSDGFTKGRSDGLL